MNWTIAYQDEVAENSLVDCLECGANFKKGDIVYSLKPSEEVTSEKGENYEPYCGNCTKKKIEQ